MPRTKDKQTRPAEVTVRLLSHEVALLDRWRSKHGFRTRSAAATFILVKTLREAAERELKGGRRALPT